MTESRSTRAWEKWVASTERHDNTVLGVSSALTAYLGQHLTVSPLQWNPQLLELGVLICFALSACASLLRSRAWGVIMQANSLRYHREDRAGMLRGRLADPKGTLLVDSETGAVFTPLQAAEEIKRLDHEARDVAARGKKWEKSAARWYVVRDVLLVLGVIGYLAAKTWAFVAA